MIKTTIALSERGFISIANTSAFGVVKRDSTEGKEWYPPGGPSGDSHSVEQTRGQRQTGRNDLPGKGERVA